MFAAIAIGHASPVEDGRLTKLRIARNQVTFREANGKIEQAAARIGLDGVVPFLCECPDESCTAVIPLDLSTYAEVRRHPRRFFNRPGHEALSVQEGAGVVVAEEDGYVLVDKVGIAGELAEAEAGR